jgi:hypothetical protein
MITLPQVTIKQDAFALVGGLDLHTPQLSLKPGVARGALNYECSINGGYTRIPGYERFDGRPSPTNAIFTVLLMSATGTLVVGDVVTGSTSLATGAVSIVDGLYVVVTKLTGTFVDGEPLTKQVSTPIANIPYIVAGTSPSTTGTPAVGNTVTMVHAAYINGVTGYTYRWLHGTTVVGTAQTLFIDNTLAGFAIVPEETAFNAVGVASPAQGLPFSITGGLAPSYDDPAAVQPGIGYQVAYVVGQQMIGDVGVPINGATSYTLRWYRNGVPISGATLITYTPVSADTNTTLSLGVFATNSSGTSVNEARTAAVFVAATTIVGSVPTYSDPLAIQPGYVYQTTYKVGTLMQGDAGAPVNAPTSYAYQHYRNGVAISGALSLAYTPITADGNKIISMGVTPSNAAGAGPEARTAGVFVTP